MAHLTERFAGVDRKRLLNLLIRAYADEWFAHYNYQLVANTISGPDWPAVGQLIEQKALRALHHANQLAARIRQLGGTLVPRLSQLSDHATDKPFKLPRNVRDTDGALKAVLDAERTSLRTYEEILNVSERRDLVTTRLATEFLAEAMEGEEKLERLLGRPAPEMTGR